MAAGGKPAGCGREVQHEGGAAARRVLVADASPVAFHDTAADRQADAVPLADGNPGWRGVRGRRNRGGATTMVLTRGLLPR